MNCEARNRIVREYHEAEKMAESYRNGHEAKELDRNLQMADYQGVRYLMVKGFIHRAAKVQKRAAKLRRMAKRVGLLVVLTACLPAGAGCSSADVRAGVQAKETCSTTSAGIETSVALSLDVRWPIPRDR